MKEITEKEMLRRQRISESRKGQRVSDYVKQRASETHKGKVTSEETKEKMRKAKEKPVKITDTVTGETFVFKSYIEAEQAFNFKSRIAAILRKKTEPGIYGQYICEPIK